MFAQERHTRIAQLVSSAGRVTVGRLADEFDLTQETIRRDLSLLESEGVLRRVHGGAVAADRASLSETTLLERSDRNTEAKRRIAQAALDLLPTTGHPSVVIDAGTTTGAFAERIAQSRPIASDGELLAITNSLTAAGSLSGAEHTEVLMLGGRIRATTGASVGAHPVERMSQLRPDIAFVGTNGVDGEFGLSTPDEQEAAIKRAFVQSADRVVVLADSSKLGERTLVQFAHLADIDQLVTDVLPGPDLAAALEEADVEVLVA